MYIHAISFCCWKICSAEIDSITNRQRTAVKMSGVGPGQQTKMDGHISDDAAFCRVLQIARGMVREMES